LLFLFWTHYVVNMMISPRKL